jgi:hypothetical protein
MFLAAAGLHPGRRKLPVAGACGRREGLQRCVKDVYHGTG